MFLTIKPVPLSARTHCQTGLRCRPQPRLNNREESAEGRECWALTAWGLPDAVATSGVGREGPRDRLGVLGAEDTSFPVTTVAYCRNPLHAQAERLFSCCGTHKCLEGK